MGEEFKRREGDGMSFLSKHWLILTTIAGCIVSYATLNASVSFMEKRLTVTEQKTECITEMRTDIKWLVSNFQELKSELKRR